MECRKRSSLFFKFFFAIFLLTFVTVTEGKRVFKRQTNSPNFGQSSYTFNMTSCSSGMFIATITANNPGGGPIAYSIDNGTGTPGNMAVNYQTGQLNLATSTTTGSFSFNYRATNFYGAAVVPVTITCGSSSSNNGISIVCFNGYCTNTSSSSSSSSTSTSYSFSVSSCTSGTTVGTVSYTNTAAYALSSSTSLFSLNPTSGQITLANSVSAGTYTLTIYAYSNSGGSSTTLTVTVTVSCSGSSSSSSFSSGLTYICFGGYCYGSSGSTSSFSSSSSGSTSYSSSSYSFTSNGCSSGSSVGTITAANANSYGITSGNSGFTISSSGVITLSSALSAGTYSIVVTAYGNSGSSSATVTITVSCSSSSSSSTGNFYINSTCLYGNCNFSSTPPVFGSSPYSFTQTSCVSGTTVGTVSATNATTYFIETGPWSNYYIINSTTGVITEVGTVPAGSPVYLTVTATNGNGVPANVLVTISTTGCVTSTSSTSTVSSASTTISTFSPYFGLSSYTLTQSTSAIGTIGTVAATNAASYSISSGNNGGFSISSTGVISATVAQPAGTYNLIETACTSNGVCVSVPVTIIVGSSTVTTTTTASTGTPVFGQPAGYSMVLTNCASGSAVGQVFATNTITYNIDNGSTFFSVDSNGNIVSTAAVPAGTYTIQVRAFSSSGATTVVPVTIIATCTAGG